ncbi:hypothetical protein PRABACTJOHN_03441 [Parabacteroides johnsonii DSM 18315]|uniref:Uncharacterized protein n=1 Tax=Parabacteroides johnsonii DSM 18315 TaxID=537006 RepID=B7BEG2_9BACT|nr:hypothetical protein PRABACTJOHN_03441 [Parabacteroides johnsonii DSM 18315]
MYFILDNVENIFDNVKNIHDNAENIFANAGNRIHLHVFFITFASSKLLNLIKQFRP